MAKQKQSKQPSITPDNLDTIKKEDETIFKIKESTIELRTIEMPKQDFDRLEDILAFTVVSHQEVIMIQQFVEKYIDKNVLHICSHCGAQVKFAHRQVTNWYTANQEFIKII